MTRFITPLLFFAVAAGTWWYNAQDNGQVLAFNFLDMLVPSLAQDLHAKGRASSMLLAGIGALMFLKAWVGLRRARAEE